MSRTFKLWFVPLFLGAAAIIIGSDIFAPYLLGGRAVIGRIYWSLGLVGVIGILVNATLAKMEGRSFLVMVWPLIAIALLLGAKYGHEIRIITSAVVGELIKSKAETEGVWFAKTKSGQFTPRAVIDGAVVDFVVDLDAPDIVLTPEAARSIGLDPSALTFDQQTGAAGKMESAANVRLRTFQLGSRMIQDLPAKVSATGKSGNVLGKAFFDRVSSWTIKHDTLMVLP